MTIKPLYPEFGEFADSAREAEVSEHPSVDLEGELSNCLVCGSDLESSDLFQRLRICGSCGFHYTIPARARIAAILDEGSFVETHRWTSSIDPLVFSPRLSYQVRVLNDQVRTGLSEAVVTGVGKIGGSACAVIAIDFGFLGGSMGLVVGEKVARMFEDAARRRLPVITFATSGGSRMQEGVLSLTQMAKTVVASKTHRGRGLPLITVLSNPSSGQILSSFASMSDIRIGEPRAHVAYASLGTLREIEDSPDIGEYANAEAMLEHGHLDMVVSRPSQRDTLATLLSMFQTGIKEDVRSRPRVPQFQPTRIDAWEAVRLSRRQDRPKASDYIPLVIRNFVELHGDRFGADDDGVIIGLGFLGIYPVMVIAQQRPDIQQSDESDDDTQTASFTEQFGNSDLNRGGVGVDGFRKARRAAKMAGDFRLPLVIFVDTPGPKLGIGEELNGLSSEIAEMISTMLSIETPVVSVLTGEGGSEAALAFSVADRLLMMENTIFTPISPEAGAATELRDRARAPEVARSLRLTSYDALRMGIADRLIAEPDGGANQNPVDAAHAVRRVLIDEIRLLTKRNPRVLARQRQRRFRHIGDSGQQRQKTVRSDVGNWSSNVGNRMRRAFRSGVRRTENSASKTDD